MFRQHGLTLLEMMVVLLIAGMAVALGFQSLGQWQRANAAIAAVGGSTQQATLTESWMEDSLRSLIPLKEVAFEGSPDRLSGVSIQPVQSHQGGATAIAWSIRSAPQGLLLQLVEDKSAPLSLPLPGALRAHFSYLDKEGKLHAQWPPKLGLHDHLPVLIVLTQEMEDGRRQLWASAISGPLNPTLQPFEDDF